MVYLSYQPERAPPPCLRPETVQLADPDTARLMVAPDSEQPEPNCPLNIDESTPTGDRYQGQVRGWRWEGLGSLTLPSGVRYDGEFRDGRFHGTGVLHFPSGGRYEGQWKHGVCSHGLFTFADGLSFSDKDWRYCEYPDRRYWSEIQHGLRPAGRSQLTDRDDQPSADLPAGVYDTGDGLYDPKCRTVYDYGDARKMKRVVTDEDHQWITSRCRRGGDTFMGRREELHHDLAPLVFQSGHSKKSPPLPEERQLDRVVRTPESPPPPPPEPAPPRDDSREQSATLVREVLRSAGRVATSVRAVLSSATGRVAAVGEEAQRLVREVERRADSAGSDLTPLAGGSGSGSAVSSEWSSADSSDEVSRQKQRTQTSELSTRATRNAVPDSSSGESMAGSQGSSGRAGRIGSGRASRSGSAEGSQAGSTGSSGENNNRNSN